MTVNHDVAGSSPAGGANRKARGNRPGFFCWLFSSWFNQGSLRATVSPPKAAMTTMFFAEGEKLVQLGLGPIGLMHDVAGSSPAGGARKKHLLSQVLFSTKFAFGE